MNVSVTLQSSIALTADGLVRVKIWVRAIENAVSGIFLFNDIGVTPENSQPGQLFVRVCSYSDLMNYPAAASTAESSYFRRAYIDMVFDSLEAAHIFRQAVQDNTALLVSDITAVSDASVAETNETV